ncbi:putative renilla-luciferin 2-monooxygenase [Apostichopus japonicus]|uniref:Putative renilla-luciferin 2-monooxygenase n=2 Tax=Stichopus japonicus TaxID=307972 RepID=A0A2G8L5F3_STIJA|nr:putative renilla-luciferin 2-monooxygenase [Apostichopus japonicus]
MERLQHVSRLNVLTSHLRNNVVLVSANHMSSSTPVITADQWWSTHKRVKILDGEMSYYDSDPTQEKSSRTAVFLHGNPTSSYLWRHIIPRVEGFARCLAPDLIGMGRSSKIPDLMYTYDDQYKYLSKWFESLNLKNKITIICHDWGSGLGLHWLHQNQQKVEGVVYFEGVIGVAKSLKSFPDISRDIFGSLRSEAGEEMVLKKNFFVERLLPNAILRELDPVEMDAYLEPFREVGESRRPTLTWPRQIPFRDTGPQNVVEIVDAYTKWLSESKDFPKMFIDGQPGFFSAGLRKQTKDWPYQRVVKVKGLHFLQEDAPIEIGDAVKDFMQSLPM